MSEHVNGNGRGRVHWDPTIKLGDLITAGVMLAGVGAAYAMLKGEVSAAGATATRAELGLRDKADKEIVGKGEVELSRRIVELHQRVNDIQVNTGGDIREIKTMVRDGFRDLDTKMDRKADKPNR